MCHCHHAMCHLIDDVILQGNVRLSQINTLSAFLSSCSCQSINQSVNQSGHYLNTYSEYFKVKLSIKTEES